MNKPNKCQWCGCGDVERQSHFLYSVLTTFACGTLCETLVGETRWFRDAQCAGQVGQAYKRIERAIEALRNADSGAVLQAILILEGESNGD